MKKTYLTLLISLLALVTSCKKADQKPPYDLGADNSNIVSVPYEEMGGVKVIPVKLNGITMNMIVDTGCSGLHMSLNELQTLYKNGKFDQSDVIGVSYSTIADGSIVENGAIRIREIEIGGEDGITIHNVEASVALNQSAPLLLGNAVFMELESVEIDNVEKVINFRRK